MTPRVQAEFEMLKNYVKNAECIEEPSRVVIQIHDYHLPPGWSVSAVEIAFFVPAGYPITPPDNFFVKPILRTSTGAAPGSYGDDASGNGMLGWAFFSFHMQDSITGVLTWLPTNDPTTGDNLLTYYRAISERLREVS